MSSLYTWGNIQASSQDKIGNILQRRDPGKLCTTHNVSGESRT